MSSDSLLLHTNSMYGEFSARGRLCRLWNTQGSRFLLCVQSVSNLLWAENSSISMEEIAVLDWNHRLNQQGKHSIGPELAVGRKVSSSELDRSMTTRYLPYTNSKGTSGEVNAIIWQKNVKDLHILSFEKVITGPIDSKWLSAPEISKMKPTLHSTFYRSPSGLARFDWSGFLGKGDFGSKCMPRQHWMADGYFGVLTKGMTKCRLLPLNRRRRRFAARWHLYQHGTNGGDISGIRTVHWFGWIEIILGIPWSFGICNWNKLFQSTKKVRTFQSTWRLLEAYRKGHTFWPHGYGWTLMRTLALSICSLTNIFSRKRRLSGGLDSCRTFYLTAPRFLLTVMNFVLRKAKPKSFESKIWGLFWGIDARRHCYEINKSGLTNSN